MRPLEGIRVIECGTIIAAPYLGMILGDYGADVIKVEHPKGDSMRGNGPRCNGVGLNFKFYGRDKRNIVLDLSKPEGQEILRSLALKSDVLIENFRPGVMERWGIGWDDLHALHPRLVMARITGFGQFGPYASRAGFGTLAEAMSGFAHINGDPDGPPMLPAFGMADSIAALSGAYAIMLALYHRDTRNAGGQMIDISLIEPIFHTLGAQTTIFEATGEIQCRTGNLTKNNAPRNIYRARDGGWVAISTSADAIARRVMHLVGHPEVIEEPWFASGRTRAEHADELDKMVGGWIAERDCGEVIAAFERAGAAIAPIYDIAQVQTDPQYQALQSIVTVPDDDLGTVKMQNLLFRMSETPGEVRTAGRRIGHDTDSVLRELLGFSDEHLHELYVSGITAPAEEVA
ncbi:MAG TPA: CoA transferase [Candidatus Acidoferrales bacterium]|nr:CoA transferase [Candidatus Acidoferrales bacterium]